MATNPLQAIQTKYHGPTNSRGARYSAVAYSGVVSVSIDHRLNEHENHTAAALALCIKFGWRNKLAHGVLASGDHVFILLEQES